jgi:DNA-directed primase/polymerase protein
MQPEGLAISALESGCGHFPMVEKSMSVPLTDTLVAACRWCGNIGRQHKSNGIYIVVDLSAGLWWQKCFDPDCRAYRSETMPLPQECARPPQPATQSSSHSTR